MFARNRSMITIESAALTDVGRIRDKNQDTYLVDDGLRLYAVADGMGGHRAGEVASALVVDSVQRYIRGESGNGSSTLPDEESDLALSRSANQLHSAIRFANQVVYDTAQNDVNCRGMGSTIAAVWFTGQTAIAANVGDSPIFLVHNNTIEPLSVLHTVEAEQKIEGHFSEDESNLPFRHMLTRGMGVDPTVKADICEAQCFRGDRIILCSDGLSNKVSPEEIRKHVTSEPAESACSRLVQLANERGGEDNITVLVLNIDNSPTVGWKWILSLPRMIKEWIKSL